MIITFIGLAAGACFAYCGVPAAITAIRTKTTFTPTSIAAMIFVGAISMYMYLFLLDGFNPVLTFNYSIETVSWAVILWYCLRRDRETRR